MTAMNRFNTRKKDDTSEKKTKPEKKPARSGDAS
jgi:hypothetical protein